MVTIRLARHGTNKAPFYRIVVTDHRHPRDGRHIENIGTYDPRKSPVRFEIDRQRLSYWKERGARPSDTVERLIKRHPAPAAS
ncbi:MAG: 30S ribosomal protein S16 [Polyangiaceae bacterium]